MTALFARVVPSGLAMASGVNCQPLFSIDGRGGQLKKNQLELPWKLPHTWWPRKAPATSLGWLGVPQCVVAQISWTGVGCVCPVEVEEGGPTHTLATHLAPAAQRSPTEPQFVGSMRVSITSIAIMLPARS